MIATELFILNIRSASNDRRPDQHRSARRPGASPEGATDETLDSVALAGAEAIQRIINDRNTLRSCTTAQQRDLATLNSINQELRRRLGLIRHHYVELATRILTQLEQFDQATTGSDAGSAVTPAFPAAAGCRRRQARRSRPAASSRPMRRRSRLTRERPAAR